MPSQQITVQFDSNAQVEGFSSTISFGGKPWKWILVKIQPNLSVNNKKEYY